MPNCRRMSRFISNFNPSSTVDAPEVGRLREPAIPYDPGKYRGLPPSSASNGFDVTSAR